VIRSTAGPLFEVVGRELGTSESSNDLMATSASADSDNYRLVAIAVNKRFSSGVGRAVIDGAVDFKVVSFTGRQRLLQQIADTSLSCHYSKNDPTTLLDANNEGTGIASTRPLRRSKYLLSVGLTRASGDSSGRRKELACLSQRPP
jgi:hypothetical protein